ncbi:MAG: hypothetical protein AMXMBFR13_26830 [Phycisphaerae bacterium]
MKRMMLAPAVLMIAAEQVAWAADEQESANLVELLVSFVPWLLVFLFIWFVLFRKLRGGVVDRSRLEQHIERNEEHMQRVEQQNQRIIQLLEQIASK